MIKALAYYEDEAMDDHLPHGMDDESHQQQQHMQQLDYLLESQSHSQDRG